MGYRFMGVQTQSEQFAIGLFHVGIMPDDSLQAAPTASQDLATVFFAQGDAKKQTLAASANKRPVSLE